MSSLLKVSLLGRPNVGKSTLFNRLIRSNRAITHDMPGVTRDRMEGTVRSKTAPAFTLIDTGGVTLTENAQSVEGPAGIRGFEKQILEQAQISIDESAVLVFVVDGREGLTPFDQHIATWVRKKDKPCLLVVNKVDGIEKEDIILAEFHKLGFPVMAVSAEHGHNIRALETEIQIMLAEMRGESYSEEDMDRDLKICFAGKPNAGKSSLVNAMLKSERMIVSDMAGTTRDSVDIHFEHKGKKYVFVDTAGIRKPSKIVDSIEKYSVNSSIKSTTKADITLMVIDASEGLTSQDKRLIDLLDERKTPFMVIINKFDLVPASKRKEVKQIFKEALAMCGHIPLIFTSALKKEGLKTILPLAHQIFEECSVRVGTGILNRSLEQVLEKHQPPVVKRIRAKFFYMTQAESSPPTFVFFVNDADRVTTPYKRYLEKALRRMFNIQHAPMRMNFRSSHKKKSEKKK